MVDQVYPNTKTWLKSEPKKLENVKTWKTSKSETQNWYKMANFMQFSSLKPHKPENPTQTWMINPWPDVPEPEKILKDLKLLNLNLKSEAKIKPESKEFSHTRWT